MCCSLQTALQRNNRSSAGSVSFSKSYLKLVLPVWFWKGSFPRENQNVSIPEKQPLWKRNSFSGKSAYSPRRSHSAADRHFRISAFGGKFHFDLQLHFEQVLWLPVSDTSHSEWQSFWASENPDGFPGKSKAVLPWNQLAAVHFPAGWSAHSTFLPLPYFLHLSAVPPALPETAFPDTPVHFADSTRSLFLLHCGNWRDKKSTPSEKKKPFPGRSIPEQNRAGTDCPGCVRHC